MYNFKVNIITIGALLFSAMANAATFTIKNASTGVIDADPMWNNRCGCYDAIGVNGELKYDSGFNSVSKIRWQERVPMASGVGVGPMPQQGQMLVKTYEAEVKLGFLNLGAVFKIYGNGSYRYEFGVDGTGDGNATVIQ